MRRLPTALLIPPERGGLPRGRSRAVPDALVWPNAFPQNLYSYGKQEDHHQGECATNHQHNTPSLLVPALLWLAFLGIALFAPSPWPALGLPVCALSMGFFLALPLHLARDLLDRFLNIKKNWRSFRYLRITMGPGVVKHGADWRFLGVARKSE
ncbi:hypothetical protein JKG47_01710 [Acidithiobacillus sp. MC6.1]|nr:hypothetical protein [Acidithiobacillus sp. MC6.1]